MGDRIWGELRTERREVLQQKCRQVTIFTKRQKVLLVQSVNNWVRVLLDDTVRNDDRPSLVGRSNPVHGETTGKTGHGTEETLESLGQMVRDIVLVNLHIDAIRQMSTMY